MEKCIPGTRLSQPLNDLCDTVAAEVDKDGTVGPDTAERAARAAKDVARKAADWRSQYSQEGFADPSSCPHRPRELET